LHRRLLKLQSRYLRQSPRYPLSPQVAVLEKGKPQGSITWSD
jgi:hypothetical protein